MSSLRGRGGFMVLSADDTTVPLLGFSDSGTLPVSEADLPDGMRYWLGSLAEQVAFNAANAPASDVSVRSRDARRRRPGCHRSAGNHKMESGCSIQRQVPHGRRHPLRHRLRSHTAMAQVLNYYKFPQMSRTITHIHGVTEAIPRI